jgi:uncharacterized protein (TIGR04206 family)
VSTRPRRLAAVVALGLVPWTVVVYPGGLDLIFPWGLVDPASRSVVDLYTYLFVYTGGPATLPDRLLAWPIASAVYGFGTLGVALGLRGYEDRRVTAGLLFVAGVAHLQVTLGLRRIGADAYPVGAVLSFLLARYVFVTAPDARRR